MHEHQPELGLSPPNQGLRSIFVFLPGFPVKSSKINAGAPFSPWRSGHGLQPNRLPRKPLVVLPERHWLRGCALLSLLAVWRVDGGIFGARNAASGALRTAWRRSGLLLAQANARSRGWALGFLSANPGKGILKDLQKDLSHLLL